jgi:hypothetical protein
LRILPAGRIGRLEAVLCEPVCLDLPNPLVWANFSSVCDAPARRSLLSRNLPRRAHLASVDLRRYPAGTLVYGDRSYLAVAGDAIIEEQIAPWCADPVDEAQRMQAMPDQAHDVGRECLLLARFGENTWGHWVSEMLSKAAIAERFFPGRFAYAVPWWTTERQSRRGFADAVLESLSAYGILPDRLIRMGGFQIYRFAALYDLTGFWQDGPHPGTLESLQEVVLPAKKGRRRKRVALVRRPPDARAVFNADEVRDFLQSEGFSAVDPGSESFASQMRLFREADLVVGSLGSGFAGSLFGGPRQRLVSLAPAGWTDGYFIRLFQHLHARHADVRGPAVEQNGVAPDRAPHGIAVEDLAAAMAVVLQPETRSARQVDGEMLPSQLGAEVLCVPFQEDGPVHTTGRWSASEPTHRWSLGPSSGLRFARSRLPSGTAFWLEIEGQGHVYPPEMPTRPLHVLVNGVPAGHFDVIGRARYFCLVAAEMLADSDDVALTFLHPVCPSPRQMGAGEDDRALGFGFEKITFHAVI